MAIDQSTVDTILERTELERIGINRLLKEVGVDRRDWCKFLAASPDVTAQYARAKQRQIEGMIDNISALEDEAAAAIAACDPTTANATVAFYKLKVDNLKWIACHLVPKTWSDRLTVEADNTLNICISNSSGKKVDI